MKLMLVALLVFLSLYQLCASLDDDYKEPEEETVERGRTVRLNLNDGEINIDHDPTADQDALLGGVATRRRLIDMPAEEAKREVRKLVERIDTNADGQLDRDELYAWLNKVEDKAFNDEAANVFNKEDTNTDGYVTVEEYLANSGIVDEDENESDMASMQESIRQRFEIADGDKDGRLSQSEFGAFVHPDRHEEMLEHLVQDQLSRFDKDTDGKISFDEYMRHYNPSGKATDEMPDWIVNEQKEFEEKLDANKDGFLDNSEIRQWIAPNDDEFFNDEIDHLLNHIDDNKDDKLSYDEFLSQLNVIIESPITDYGHTVHEEL